MTAATGRRPVRYPPASARGAFFLRLCGANTVPRQRELPGDSRFVFSAAEPQPAAALRHSGRARLAGMFAVRLMAWTLY